ncbi:hypothetical protein GCM10009677_04130 [Sphaerisporangium rubeum]
MNSTVNVTCLNEVAVNCAARLIDVTVRSALSSMGTDDRSGGGEQPTGPPHVDRNYQCRMTDYAVTWS